MCTPTLGAGLALSAGGSLLSNRDARDNQQSVANARNSVLASSLARQDAYGKEARGFFDTRMQDYAPGAQDTALTAAQDGRTGDILKNVTQSSADDIPLSASAPQVVKGEIAKRMLKTFQQATDRAKAAGKLGGYGDTWFNNNVGVADTARRVGTVNNFAANDAALLPAEQDFAQIGATRQPSIWGPLLQTGGNLLAGAAGRGASPFVQSADLGYVPGLGTFRAGV